MQTALESNLEALRARIAEAARRAGRDPRAIELVAVTKSVEPELAAALCRLSVEALGESRADELERKAQALAAEGLAPRWHFVGRLQRNKVARVVRIASAIHSVDTPELLEAIERAAAAAGRRPDVYLQVKLADEPSKGGLPPAALPALVERARSLDHARLCGLMALAPLEETAALAERGRPPGALAAFGALAALARTLDARAFHGGRPRLSMGMSGDLEAAVEAGADVVRVGGALFAGAEAAR